MDRPCQQDAAESFAELRATRRRVLWSSVVLVAALNVGACDARSTSSHLVTLDSFDVAEEDETPTLSLRGSGFPIGRPCQLEARGTLYEKSQAARRIKQRLACRAVSENFASATLEPWLQKVKGTPLFEGELRIEFADDDGTVRLVSEPLNGRFRLDDPSTHDAAAAVALAQSARAFQREIGLPELEAQMRGLTVTRVTEDSPARRAGLAPGDRILRINSAPVEAPEDLQRPLHTASIQLTVERPGQREPMRFELGESAPQSAHSTQASFFFLALGAVAAFLLRGPHARAAANAPALSREALPLLGASLLLGLSAVAFGAMDVRVLWGLPAALHLGALAWAYQKRKLLFADVLRSVVEIGAATLGVAALGLAHGSLHVPTNPLSLVPPFDFDMFANPATWLGCATLLWSQTDEGEPAQPGHFDTRLLLAAGRFACLFGFATAAMNLRVFVCVVAVGALLMQLPKPKLPHLAHALLALLAPAWALTLVAFDAPRLPQALCALMTGVILAYGLRCFREKIRPSAEARLDPALSPFV